MANDVIGMWPERVDLRIWIKNEGDGMYGALVEQFNIAGQGNSVKAAQENAVELTLAYLNSYMSEGASFEEAERPISNKLRLRLQVEMRLANALTRLPRVKMPKVQLVADVEDLHSDRTPAHC